MIVKIFVEGKSDKKAMEDFLAPLIAEKNNRGIGISFYTAKTGDAKKFLLLTLPALAVDILCHQSDVIVAVMPDLYPKNKGFPHETFAELESGIMERFARALETKGLGDDFRLRERFKVFCFQHDLEVLILAAEERLKEYLGVKSFKVSWQTPVEEQNQDLPPKRIVERLFESCGRKYKEVSDAASILQGADYEKIADRCPQSFKPFMEFIENL